ncbi:MAG: RICIN domain-containing protein [Dysgonamonadaceae bacterium]|jgi:hypothetical protein|nr:RICIN domain-containing protein [Dysgonamonadaceae bacterium]
MTNKNKSHIFLCFMCFFFGNAVQAQKFEESMASVADNPQWFIIQVKGAGATAGLAITENNGAIAGEAFKIGGHTEIAKQLWRIEPGTGSATYKTYRIINKFSGNKLDIAYNAGKAKRTAVAVETPLTEWRIVNNYNLRATTEPAEGTTGYCYLTQTGGEDAYSFIFSPVSAISNDNAKFEFWSLNSLPLVSTENEIAWLRIRNAKTSLAGKYLTDAGDATANSPFLMLDRADNDHSQQWKIVSKNAPDESGRVDFVNRATGRAVGTATVYNAYYYPQAFTGLEENEGWRILSLNNALYEIASGSLSGAWFWNGTTDGEPPRVYSGKPDPEQGYAWSFSLVDETATGIQSPVTLPNIRIYTHNRVIYVEGTNQYAITNICGLRVPNNRQLPIGMYLVTVGNKTTKVLVK